MDISNNNISNFDNTLNRTEVIFYKLRILQILQICNNGYILISCLIRIQ